MLTNAVTWRKQNLLSCSPIFGSISRYDDIHAMVILSLKVSESLKQFVSNNNSNWILVPDLTLLMIFGVISFYLFNFLS